MKPKISVVIRTRQSPRNLDQCIRSALNQSLSDIELIIINDESPQANRYMLDGILDSRITVYGKEGKVLGRNFGIEKASADYIAFLDADDYWRESKLEKQYALLEETGADVCYGWADLVDSESRLIKSGSREIHIGEVYTDLVLSNFLDCRSNALIRKSTLLETGGFDDTMTIAEDWDLYLRLALKATYVCCQEVLISYRQTQAELDTPVLAYEQSFKQLAKRLFESPDKSATAYQSLVLGNWNRQLLNMALEQAKAENIFVAFRCLANAIKHDPNLWRHRMVWRVIVKISHMFLPQPLRMMVIEKLEMLEKIELIVQTFAPVVKDKAIAK